VDSAEAKEPSNRGLGDGKEAVRCLLSVVRDSRTQNSKLKTQNSFKTHSKLIKEFTLSTRLGACISRNSLIA
jgi:hypothetical protein